ncbi:MAG: transporter substrate-binding domain-containing protein [Marinisporobacter sp.]|jgi:polar amino acid transport system substrate-binding protein|nr:transporter substrate-binding domain-containing protein [Marinisporobacter sp.]
MKKVLLILIVILMSTSYVVAEFQGENPIKVGGDNHLPPYHYVNNNGIYKGFCVDIIRAIAIQKGLDIELYPMPFYSIEENKDIDMILGLEKNKEYENIYDFSAPYLTIFNSIFVKKDSKFIADIEDLNSVKIGIQKGNIPKKLKKYIRKESVEYVENQQDGFLLLMMGKIDAFIGNRLTGLYTIQKMKQTNFIKIVGQPVSPVEYCFAFRKGNENLVRIFDEGLKEIKDNGTYDEIYNKWFGEIIKTPLEMQISILKKIFWILIIIVIGIFIVFRANHFLKREVMKKTEELQNLNNSLIESNKKIKKEYILRQQIFNSVYHGIMTISKEGVINFVNLKLEEITGHGHIFNESIYDTSMMKIISKKELEDVLTFGKQYIRKEKSIDLGDEKKIFVYSICPLNGEQGNLIGAVISLEDITKEKEIQEKLIQKDKMHVLGELMAIIAHELRNPLTSIKTFIDLIPQKFESKKFRERLLYYVPSELDRMNKLVTDLLHYVSPKKVDKMQVKIEKLVLEVITLLENKIIKSNIHVIRKIESNAIIYADRKQLKQVLINLILNSIQAIDKENGKIEIICYNDDTNCIIKMIDNGRGIQKEKIKRVMEPFFTDKENGTGLGLAICYQIVKEHGGQFKIISEVDKGTEVHLIFQEMQ